MHHSYNARSVARPARPKRSHTPFKVVLCLIILAAGYVGYALFRPLPGLHTTITPPVVPALVKVSVPWPSSAPTEQAAYGAVGYGLLAQKDPGTPETPVPTASVAKVVTALAILAKKPLLPGATGPLVLLSASDVNIYNQYVAEDGSVVPVTAGESITEQEGLQAMMLPSANNIADSMAIWAFGSLDAYNSYANSFVKKLGMNSTTITSASGFLPTTVSTATDLIKLGAASLKNPTLTAIVSQPQATTPDFGTISNVNVLVGQYGITGLKTGNTDQAGGCYLTTATVTIGDKPLTIITAVMESPSLPQALRDALPLVQSAPSLFQDDQIVQSGQIVGQATTAWGSKTNVIATKGISATAWTGTAIVPTSTTKSVTLPTRAQTSVGSMSLTFNGTTETSDLELAQAVGKPGLVWRIKHPV